MWPVYDPVIRNTAAIAGVFFFGVWFSTGLDAFAALACAAFALAVHYA